MQRIGRKTCHAEWVERRSDLGGDFAKEEQQEGDNNGGYHKLDPSGHSAEIEEGGSEDRQKQGKSDINEVVGNKDGGQQSLWLIEQRENRFIGAAVAILEGGNIVR